MPVEMRPEGKKEPFEPVGLSADRLAGLLFMLIAVIYGFFAWHLPTALVADSIGPSFYPLLLSGMGAILGAVLFLSRTPNKIVGVEQEWPQIVSALALIALYVLFLNLLGFVLATFVFLTVSIWLLRGPSLMSSVLAALMLTAAVYVLMVKLLALRFPEGFITFWVF